MSFANQTQRYMNLIHEIESTRNALDKARRDPSYTLEQIASLRDELDHLNHDLFMRGSTLEYEF